MPNPSQEVEWVEQAQAGDLVAFEYLVEANKEKSIQLAYAWTHDYELARDVAQEAFIKVYKNLKQFKVQSKFSTWLARIVINQCKDSFKKQKEVLMRDETIFEMQIDPHPHPLEGIQAEDKSKELMQLVNCLAQKQKQAILLRYFHEQSLEEIAEIMGVALGTIKATLHQAMANLKHHFNEKETTGYES